MYGNDPTQPRAVIPVRMTVTGGGQEDEIFADGFDGSGSGNAATIAQTTDSTPVVLNSAACGNDDDQTTADNQYWRRYYFGEYGISSAAEVASVDVSVEQTSGTPSLTVTLYTIPHSVTVDTIDPTQLTQIGQATITVPSGATMTSVNVPIAGTVSDTVAHDLVVEVSTDDFRDGHVVLHRFDQLGGNPSQFPQLRGLWSLRADQAQRHRLCRHAHHRGRQRSLLIASVRSSRRVGGAETLLCLRRAAHSRPTGMAASTQDFSQFPRLFPQARSCHAAGEQVVAPARRGFSDAPRHHLGHSGRTCSPVDVAFAHSAMANDAAASPYKYVLPKGVRPDASTGAQLITC